MQSFQFYPTIFAVYCVYCYTFHVFYFYILFQAKEFVGRGTDTGFRKQVTSYPATCICILNPGLVSKHSSDQGTYCIYIPTFKPATGYNQQVIHTRVEVVMKCKTP